MTLPTLLTWLAASTSGLAILLYAAGVITLTYAVTILAPPTLLVFLGVLVRSGRLADEFLLDRLRGGFVAGAVGLIAYDLFRLLILLSGLVQFNPFRPIEVYGLLILDAPEDTALTRAVGWTFHVWNGLTFAAMYTLACGRGRTLWALGWAMLLELAMISAYPSIFRLVVDWQFLVMSASGHVAYGLGVGEVAKRVVRT